MALLESDAQEINRDVAWALLGAAISNAHMLISASTVAGGAQGSCGFPESTRQKAKLIVTNAAGKILFPPFTFFFFFYNRYA